MIPIKLSMRNFMCYRDNVPPLDFNGIHTACICGDNGNGKSALVDAMTWAVWGRTRAKSDDDLVHSGGTEMEVEFDFAVGRQPYRILRKRSKPSRRGSSGRTILEFQVATEDGFKSITGNSVAQTEQKIRDTLHMDYDTFVSSAFLRQGHADEFTKQPPTRRKQVLADILGLSFYDALEGQAKELAREQEAGEVQFASAIKDITDELAQKPTYESELERAESQLSRIEEVMKEQESRLNKLRQEKESLENKKLQLEQLEKHVAETQRDLERWDELIRQHRSRLEEYEELMSQRATIEEGYTQLTEARRQSDNFNQKLGLLVKLRDNKSQLEMAIERAQASLITQHKLAQTKITELEAVSLKLPQLKDELQQIQVKLHLLSEEEEKLGKKRQTSQQLQAELRYLEASISQLKQEMEDIDGKLRLLLTQADARCPLCETELGSEGLKLIEKNYEADKQSKSDTLALNQVQLADKKLELESLEKEASQLEIKLSQDRAAAQGKASVLSQQIAEAEAVLSRLAEERKTLAEIEEQLARKDFAIGEQKALGELEKELTELNYDSQQHEEVRHRLVGLEHYEPAKRRLEEADRLYTQEREALSRAEKASKELWQSLEVDNQKKQELVAELGLLPQRASDLAQAEAEHQALTTQQQQAQESVWTAKEKLQRCSELEEKKKEKERLLAEASKREKIYKDLAEAFGKKGVQALLIEMALPEVEVEANRLLARMTDNRMHVKIETQRETKKGDLQETLDINISDELGTRNYEMFSGGEAFRIDFAIRIALSKLLARRAGSPLPTLIIDEGFGTQDSDGLEKLKEAINSIQDDFDKILVITHIDELKDAFPTRIDVTKTAQGSTLQFS